MVRERFQKSTIRTKATRIQATSQMFPIIKILVRYLIGIQSVYRRVRVSYVSRVRQVSGKVSDY